MKEKTMQEDIYRRIDRTIAFNWIRLRQDHDLSIFELSEGTGIHHTVICDLENHLHIRLTDEDCRKTAAYYGMTYEALMKELTKSLSENEPVPGKDITRADLRDVYPYNLVMLVNGEIPDPAEVSLIGLEELLGLLSESERTIIDLRYRYGLSIKSIAEKTGMSREKVRAKEARVLKRMRCPGWRKMLKSYTYSDLLDAEEEG